MVLAATAIAAFSPTLNWQIAALDAEGPASPAYIAADRRARGVGMFLGVLVVVAVVVMVFKPTF